jgi:exodeoxyribonuclease VII large subunit
MQVRTVSEITLHIKNVLDGDPELADIWITGEISNFKRAASGHCYFTLQDSQAEIRCVMWRQQATRLDWAPQQGDLAEAHGCVSVYERGGAYQFYVDQLARGGVGLRWLQFLQLKERLEAEGLFAPGRKRGLPAWPRRIGVVTSPTGAAIRDILRVIGARYPLVEVVISPTPVQGDEAPAGIVAAIERLNAQPDIDVVIVARGGGSVEDLWAFNDEGVARAIVASRAPVISGVGHETDLTITDLAADVHTATPSTAAAAAVPDGDELRANLAERRERLTELVAARLGSERQALTQAERLLRRFDPRHRLAERRQRVDDLVQRATHSMLRRIELQRARLKGDSARIKALDPRRVLARGFAVVQDSASGARIHSITQLAGGQALDIHLSDGRAHASVVSTDSEGS